MSLDSAEPTEKGKVQKTESVHGMRHCLVAFGVIAADLASKKSAASLLLSGVIDVT